MMLRGLQRYASCFQRGLGAGSAKQGAAATRSGPRHLQALATESPPHSAAQQNQDSFGSVGWRYTPPWFFVVSTVNNAMQCNAMQCNAMQCCWGNRRPQLARRGRSGNVGVEDGSAKSGKRRRDNPRNGPHKKPKAPHGFVLDTVGDASLLKSAGCSDAEVHGAQARKQNSGDVVNAKTWPAHKNVQLFAFEGVELDAS
jgi:hypothetical protein